jgi:hypothetical protein
MEDRRWRIDVEHCSVNPSAAIFYPRSPILSSIFYPLSSILYLLSSIFYPLSPSLRQM